MKLQRFHGASAREAMQRVREALGEDALIVGNRRIGTGVELLAIASEHVPPMEATLAAQAPVAQRAPRERADAAAGGSGPAGRAAGDAKAGDPAAGGRHRRAEPAWGTVHPARADDDEDGDALPQVRAWVPPRLETPAAGSPQGVAPARRTVQAARDRAGANVDAGDAGEDAEGPLSLSSFRRLVSARLRERRAGRTGARAPADEIRADDEPAGAGPDPAARDARPRRAAPAAPAGRARADATPRAVVERPIEAPGAPTLEASAPQLMAELRSLRALIADQFASAAWLEGVRRGPVQSSALRRLLGAGFTVRFARELLSRLPSDFSAEDAERWIAAAVARSLRCAPDPAEAGGTWALVGPTGVGKTTTIAKLAARHVARHGAQSVGLITVDTWRLGARDQLAGFARVLGVPVHTAGDADALAELLALLERRRLVLIDTAGMGQRDPRIAEMLAAFDPQRVRRLVVLNGAAQTEAIDEVVRAWHGDEAEGVVLSKVDEAVTLGGALDCLIRHRLPLLGVADGQRVPEDWQAADATRLASLALAARQPAGFEARDDEWPVLATLGTDPGPAPSAQRGRAPSPAAGRRERS